VLLNETMEAVNSRTKCRLDLYYSYIYTCLRNTYKFKIIQVNLLHKSIIIRFPILSFENSI